MTRHLRSLLLPLLLVLVHAGTGLALTLSFADTVAQPGTLSWTHVIDDFTAASPGDNTFVVTDVALDILLTFKADKDDVSPIKGFIVASSGDGIALATLEHGDTAGKRKDYLWHIDLSDFVNIDQLLSDRSLTVSLEVLRGTLESVDAATLSGTASLGVFEPNPPNGPSPTHAPEPGTLLLVGLGLLGLIGFRKNGKEVTTE